jgi:hypothetical protein
MELKNDKLYFIEIKDFCSVENVIKRIKSQAIAWEKIIA